MMSKTRVILWAVLTLFLVAIVGATGSWAFTIINRAEAERVALASAATRLEPAGLRMVYLAAHDHPALTAAAQTAPVVVLEQADWVKRLDAQMPLDVLVFDAALANQLDPAWLQARYAQGMAVVGVNVGIVDLARSVGEARVLAGPWQNGIPTAPASYYSLLQLVVTGDNPDEVALYVRTHNSLVGPDGALHPMAGLTSSLSIQGSASQTVLTDEATFFDSLADMIVDATP